LFAGRDGNDDSRARLQIDVINSFRPDVFLMQEARGFDAAGSELLFAMEGSLGMRGFLAIAPVSGQNTAIFIRSSLRAVAFEADGAHFHHAAAALTVALPGARSLTFITAHLCPNGAAVRRAEAAYLATRAAPDRLVLLAGDFNSASPHDAEPLGLDELSPNHRARYLGDDGRTADRTVLAALEAAGWVDVGHAIGDARVPTVPCVGFVDTEFPTMRCDYVLATRAMAQHAASYEVIRTAQTDVASDHYPVRVTFEGLI